VKTWQYTFPASSRKVSFRPPPDENRYALLNCFRPVLSAVGADENDPDTCPYGMTIATILAATAAIFERRRFDLTGS
jgi:hypothetical protein